MMTTITQITPRTRRRAPARRGVLLLVVLGMLAMFAMIGVAFVLLAGHSRDGAEAQQKKEFYVANPEKFTGAALEQILCGTNNPASVLRNHSLLEDMYGNPTPFESAIHSAVARAGGQVLDIQYINPYDGNILTAPEQMSLKGRVLTFTSGPAEGESVRILSAGPATVYTTMPKNLPEANNTFLVNGAAFGGKGFGYNVNAVAGKPELSAADPVFGLPLALLPNPTAFEDTGIVAPAYDDPSGPGGANEEYDAVDYQNMLLALQLPNGQVPCPSLHRPSLVNYWIRALSAGLEGLVAEPASAGGDVLWGQLFTDPGKYYDASDETERSYINTIRELKRRIILRPLHDYHPNFTGSTFEGKYNPLWNPLWDGVTIGEGQWDVDNDGDGIKDSIWVDIGLPVQTTTDGRRYKPLVAILCVDLDGRLNLNAHGCLAQAGSESKFGSPSPCGGMITGMITDETKPHPDRGQGWGPAEVNLGTLLDGDYLAMLLQGDGTNPGRYGADGLPGGSTTWLTTLLDPGDKSAVMVEMRSDYGRPYDFSGYPFDYLGFAENGTGLTDFGSPADLKGGMQVALDWRGQPVYQTLDSSGGLLLPYALNVGDPSLLIPEDNPNDALVGQPYELDLSPDAPRGPSMTAADSLFSPAELERLLRPYDVDTKSLPDRLERLLPGTINRRLITTESCDVASVPNVVNAERLTALATALGTDNLSAKKQLDQFPVGVPQLLVIALLEGGMDYDYIKNNFAVIGHQLLGPELMAGLPLNINRRMTPRNSSCNITQNNIERRAMARHLYCLAMLLANLEYLDKVAWKTFTDTAPDDTEKRKYTCRLLAQWAVNVVDFRCNDSIMTPFEYDINPFHDDGTAPTTTITADPTTPAPPSYFPIGFTWNVDGFLDGEVYKYIDDDQTITIASSDDAVAPATHPDRAVVWGCSRPELVISESFGLHDRRTTDEDVDNLTTDTAPKTPDEDFDQKWMPEGSLFIEIYNPWSLNESPHLDVCDVNGGVHLDQTTPGNSPVWRLAVTDCLDNPSSAKRDLNHPIVSERPKPIRTIYFTKSGSVTLPDDIDKKLQLQPSSKTPEIAPVLPGRYTVIGPGNPDDEAISTTLFGFRTGMTPGVNGEVNKTRRIVLAPNGNPEASQVQVYGDGTNNDLDSLPIQNPTAVIINYPVRLSVTEPDPTEISPGKYETYTSTDYDPTSGYATVFDEPLDKTDGTYWSKPNIKLNHDGTWPGVFIVHLQRLADPTKEYDQNTNPYVTIDIMPVDITSFNGLATPATSATDTTYANDGIHLNSRERGATDANFDEVQNGEEAPNLWSQEPVNKYRTDPIATQAAATKSILEGDPPMSHHYLSKDLYHSLGYLNGSYRESGHNPIDSLSLFGATDSGFDTLYKGSPEKPFPWLNWNNRPYISKYELMLVPNTPSNRLLTCYGLGKTETNPYDFPEDGNLSDLSFPHLMNFFSSAASHPAVGGPVGSELYRIFDHVRVPSRFVKTRKPLTDTPFVNDSHWALLSEEGRKRVAEQYRGMTDRREPGRVNLNTICDDISSHPPNPITSALVPWMDYFTEEGATTKEGLYNNRWRNLDPTIFEGIHPKLPTRFPNVFRSAQGQDLVPFSGSISMRNTISRGVNATFLRELGLPGSGEKPYFVETITTMPGEYCNTTRNPYFAYETLTRLGNTAGTRSNVYAVWVTVGYFEVEPITFIDKNSDGLDDVFFCSETDFKAELEKPEVAAKAAELYPDGVRIGQEVGADSGEIKRNRAFYMIDRSIPVGFKRGQLLNAKKAVLIQRNIE